jgi:Glycosyl transferases group 1
MNRKILIIHKGGTAHTWCEDLQAGFHKISGEAHVLALRSHRLAERKLQYQHGHKYFENAATVARLAARIRHLQPHLIVLLNYVGLPDEAHDHLRNAAAGAPIVSWLADHIEYFPARAHANLDAVYYFDSATLPVLKQAYAATQTRLNFLPLAVNPSRFPDRGLAWAERQPGLVFVGNNCAFRRALIRELRALGTKISAYGPRAESGLKLWHRRKISPAGSTILYGAHQAVLNLLQPPNTIHGLNLRAYEIAASGGLGCYPLTPDLEESYVPSEEIVGYSSPADLHHQLERIFSDPSKAQAIIKAGQARVLRDHTYAVRAQKLLADWCP